MAKDKESVKDKAAKKFSRRDFLAVGGTALAGGALAVYPAKKTAAEEKISILLHIHIKRKSFFYDKIIYFGWIG